MSRHRSFTQIMDELVTLDPAASIALTFREVLEVLKVYNNNRHRYDPYENIGLACRRGPVLVNGHQVIVFCHVHDAKTVKRGQWYTPTEDYWDTHLVNGVWELRQFVQPRLRSYDEDHSG